MASILEGILSERCMYQSDCEMYDTLSEGKGNNKNNAPEYSAVSDV